jgi:hypothetical protein
MESLPDFIYLLDVPATHPWLTERCLRQAVVDRTIPHYKRGNRVLFATIDLDGLLVKVSAGDGEPAVASR